MAKIKHVDLSVRVYDTIKKMIISGSLAPGQKILQEKLAREIGVSRTPLLKALQFLEHELLVESIPRRGMFVKKMEPKEIIDAFECREGLEGIAARLAARNITPKQVQELKDLFVPFAHGNDKIAFDDYLPADQRFHQLLISISKNQVISRIEMLGNVHIICYNRGLIRAPEETLAEHFGIIEALEQGDGALAEKRAKEHLLKSRNRIEETFQKNGQSPNTAKPETKKAL